MKKILALVLVISCVFALGSCKLVKKWFGKDKTDAPVVNAADVTPVQEKLDASVPETAKITVSFKSSLGELESSYDVTYNLDGTATVVYYYEKFNTSTEGDSFKDEYNGQVLINANGELVGAPAGMTGVEALAFDINLDPTKLYSATVTSGVLHAVVKAENTAAVLGVAIGADVELIVAVGTLGVGSISVSYVTAEGSVEIITTYTYYVAPEEDPEAELE